MANDNTDCLDLSRFADDGCPHTVESETCEFSNS